MALTGEQIAAVAHGSRELGDAVIQVLQVATDRSLPETLRTAARRAYVALAGAQLLFAHVAGEGSPPLRSVCAWCKAHMGGPVDAPPERTSHGLCAGCYPKVNAS